MDNIFENAFFGKAYKTRDDSKAIFICKRTDNSRYDLNHTYACIVDGLGEIFNFYPNGKLYLSDNFETENDIVSEWHEEISEEELDELANEYITENDDWLYNKLPCRSYNDTVLKIIKEVYKAGCRKEKEM